MSTTPAAAFVQLQRDLVRRRLAAIEPRLRLEVAALAILIGGFLFWQLRMRYNAIAPDPRFLGGALGPRAVVLIEVASILLALAVAGGAAAGFAHARRLRGGTGSGLAWLTLPVPPHLVARHLAWESKGWALLPAMAGISATVAAIGLAPPVGLLLVTASAVVVLLEATRIACALALRLARRAPQSPRGGPRITAVLANVTVPAIGRRVGAPSWRRSGPTRALITKDALLLFRDRTTRTRLIRALALVAVSFTPWVAGGAEAGAHVIGFMLALLAAASAGEVILALAGTDPFAALRVLPVGGLDVWRARAVWALAVVVLLIMLHTTSALRLSPGAAQYYLTVLALATTAVLALALNYAVTLYPQADQAARLYGLSLALAVIGSLLIPLLGWVVLLSAVIHSARRLPRWWRLEERG